MGGGGGVAVHDGDHDEQCWSLLEVTRGKNAKNGRKFTNFVSVGQWPVTKFSLVQL
jgi:hypothetical protein